MDGAAQVEDEDFASPCPRLLCATRLRFQKDVTRVAVNSTGSLAALCGKKLSVIGLSAPFAVARELTLANKAAPLGAQFSPHQHQASCLGSHTGQTVFLFNLNDARSPLQASLQHQRNVRSFAWSLFDCNVVATCAADNAIHLWDLRDLKNPKASSTFKVFTSGLASVRWNKLNSNLLASSHDIQVEIWDLRKSAPVTFITAHPTKIANVDWSPTAENELITSSADGTVKLWDVKRSRICQGTIQTGSPVAKALYAPSGQAVVVLNAPPVLHARVWSLQAPLQPGAAPVVELAGNKDLCPDIAMCERVAAHGRDVIAWSRDAHLCIWELPDAGAPSAASIVSGASSLGAGGGGGVLNSPASAPSSSSMPSLLSQPGSPAVRGREAASTTPSKTAQQLHSLRDELDDMEHSPVAGVSTESQIAALSRLVVVRTTDAEGRAVAMKMAFPSLYPHNASPSFEFLLPETELPTGVVVSLLAALQSLCRRLTSQSQYCLRPAVQLLRKSVLSEELMQRKRSSTLSASTGALSAAPAKPEPGSGPVETPCPRLSGATFSPTGRLVHFSNGINFSVRTYGQLREALAGAVQPLSIMRSPLDDAVSDSEPVNLVQPVVTHYTLPHIGHVSATLANSYRVSGAPVHVLCAHNADAARAASNWSVARAWQSLAAVAEACESGALPLRHALARPMVHQILAHYEAASDIQTVAVMSRVLLSGAKPLPAQSAMAAQVERQMKTRKSKLPPPSSAVLAAGGEVVLGAPGAPPDSKVWTKRLFQKNKKRAESDAPAPAAPELAVSSYLVSSPPAMTVAAVAVALPPPSSAASLTSSSSSSPALFASQAWSHSSTPLVDGEKCLIDAALIPRYLALQRIYADLCLYFNLIVHRAQVLKLSLHALPAPLKAAASSKGGLSFEPTCLRCNRNAVGSRHCPSCNCFLFSCFLCRAPVSGLWSVCVYCGHGGHTKTCMSDWFASNDTCPTQGCSCKCKST